jgi:hypothetical protein
MWRKLHTKKLHNLYSSRNIIKVIRKERSMRWVGGHAAAGDIRNTYKNFDRETSREKITREI